MNADRLKILTEIKNEASVNQSLDSQDIDKKFIFNKQIQL